MNAFIPYKLCQGLSIAELGQYIPYVYLTVVSEAPLLPQLDF